ncbi:unnamed protein product, partial [Laminaria digitata]
GPIFRRRWGVSPKGVAYRRDRCCRRRRPPRRVLGGPRFCPALPKVDGCLARSRTRRRRWWWLPSRVRCVMTHFIVLHGIATRSPRNTLFLDAGCAPCRIPGVGCATGRVCRGTGVPRTGCAAG